MFQLFSKTHERHYMIKYEALELRLNWKRGQDEHWRIQFNVTEFWILEGRRILCERNIDTDITFWSCSGYHINQGLPLCSFNRYKDTFLMNYDRFLALLL